MPLIDTSKPIGFLKDGIEYTDKEVRVLYKNIAFPKIMKNIEIGYTDVYPSIMPTPTTNLKRVIRNGTEIDDLGNTVQAWVEVDMFTSDLLDEGGVTVLKTIAEQETEYLAKLELDTLVATKIRLKNMYLATVDTKLKELDYDSLATVKLWADDTTFGTEATRIITWYKAIIAMNHQLIADVTNQAVSVPTDEEYQDMINSVGY